MVATRSVTVLGSLLFLALTLTPQATRASPLKQQQQRQQEGRFPLSLASPTSISQQPLREEVHVLRSPFPLTPSDTQTVPPYEPARSPHRFPLSLSPADMMQAASPPTQPRQALVSTSSHLPSPAFTSTNTVTQNRPERHSPRSLFGSGKITNHNSNNNNNNKQVHSPSSSPTTATTTNIVNNNMFTNEINSPETTTTTTTTNATSIRSRIHNNNNNSRSSNSSTSQSVIISDSMQESTNTHHDQHQQQKQDSSTQTLPLTNDVGTNNNNNYFPFCMRCAKRLPLLLLSEPHQDATTETTTTTINRATTTSSSPTEAADGTSHSSSSSPVEPVTSDIFSLNPSSSSGPIQEAEQQHQRQQELEQQQQQRQQEHEHQQEQQRRIQLEAIKDHILSKMHLSEAPRGSYLSSQDLPSVIRQGRLFQPPSPTTTPAPPTPTKSSIILSEKGE